MTDLATLPQIDYDPDGMTPFHMPPPPRPRGLAWLAWIVVALVVGFILSISAFVDIPADPAGGRFVLEMQSKYLVGANQWPGVSGSMLFDQSEMLDIGPVEQRLCVVALAGELAGPEKAADQLSSLLRVMRDHKREPTERQQALIDALDDLYADFETGAWDAPSLSAEERELLKSELGWFGELALVPPATADHTARDAALAPATRTLWVIVSAAGLGLLLFFTGVVLLIVFLVQAMLGRIHWRHDVVPAVGGIYAEAFAVWMVLFIALSVAADFALPDAPFIPMNLAVQALGLLALGWPLLRRVPWRRLREEIGLTAGRGASEFFWGFAAYAATLPLLAIGILAMLALAAVQAAVTGAPDPFDAANAGAHPIVGWIATAGFWDRALLLLLACVGAPITEEIFFRGLLYRHLREASRAWRMGLSVVFSAGATGFVFAIIHPQGVVAVPVLGALAFGFAVAREWRGSLVAPIVAHAFNNGAVMTLMLLIV